MVNAPTQTSMEELKATGEETVVPICMGKAECEKKTSKTTKGEPTISTKC
jgi:hypothetical protein